jgi:hypothetical protein
MIISQLGVTYADSSSAPHSTFSMYHSPGAGHISSSHAPEDVPLGSMYACTPSLSRLHLAWPHILDTNERQALNLEVKYLSLTMRRGHQQQPRP